MGTAWFLGGAQGDGHSVVSKERGKNPTHFSSQSRVMTTVFFASGRGAGEMRKDHKKFGLV